MLRQNPLVLTDHVVDTLADTEFLKFYIANSTLTAAIFELVGRCYSVFGPNEIVTI